ncbi:MAG TPA: hypothetical protein VGS98_00775 [Thermoanaerobaculia bacterium]|nr:hypothetical protein [Thermoanaerobaculia bacterium]
MLSVTSGFAVLIIVVMIATVTAVGRRFIRAAAVASGATGNRPPAVRLVTPLIGGWLVLAIALATTGFFVTDASEAPPRIAWAVVPLVLGIALLAASPGLRRTIDAVPPDRLIGVQLYRVLGGVFLVGWALGIFPTVFALPAGFGDVLIGVTAPLVAKNLRNGYPLSRRLAILWNVVGLADLVMAVTLGVLSAPGQLQRFAFDRPNVAISEFPFVIVPTVLVPLSVLLHVFSLRSLTRSRSAAIPVGLDRRARGLGTGGLSRVGEKPALEELSGANERH